MTSITHKIKIIYEENIQKENREKIYEEILDKLNGLFGEKIELNNIPANLLEGERNNEIDKKESNNYKENNVKEDKKRKKAIYELLKFYKKANVDKSFKFKLSPFRRLIEPKKIQMDGRILLNKQEN